MQYKNETILKISDIEFDLILKALIRAKNSKEVDILINARKIHNENKAHRKIVLSLNKELQVIKTKQKITKAVNKIRQSGNKVTPSNISRISKISLPTIYKYKELY